MKVLYDNGTIKKEFDVRESNDYPHHYLDNAPGSHTGGGTLLKKYCTTLDENGKIPVEYIPEPSSPSLREFQKQGRKERERVYMGTVSIDIYTNGEKR